MLRIAAQFYAVLPSSQDFPQSSTQLLRRIFSFSNVLQYDYVAPRPIPQYYHPPRRTTFLRRPTTLILTPSALYNVNLQGFYDVRFVWLPTDDVNVVAYSGLTRSSHKLRRITILLLTQSLFQSMTHPKYRKDKEELLCNNCQLC